MSSIAVETSIAAPLNPTARVILASLIGTTIEFYDFYVYATAAVLVFPVCGSVLSRAGCAVEVTGNHIRAG